VLSKVREALALHKETGLGASFGASDRHEWVAEALYYAGEEALVQGALPAVQVAKIEIVPVS